MPAMCQQFFVVVRSCFLCFVSLALHVLTAFLSHSISLLFLLPCVRPQVLQGTTMQQLQQVQVAQSQATPITVNYSDPKPHLICP